MYSPQKGIPLSQHANHIFAYVTSWLPAPFVVFDVTSNLRGRVAAVKPRPGLWWGGVHLFPLRDLGPTRTRTSDTYVWVPRRTKKYL